MIPISSAISGGLIWSKIPHKNGFELKREGEVIASLQQKSCWSMEFQAESECERWKFRRTGFWRPATEIVDADSDMRIAILKPNWGGGGALEFSDGQIFRVTSKGFLRPVWSVLTDGGQPVLKIRSREKTVELSNQSHLPEGRLILLATFAWYMVRQAAQDAASAAVVVVAIS